MLEEDCVEATDELFVYGGRMVLLLDGDEVGDPDRLVGEDEVADDEVADDEVVDVEVVEVEVVEVEVVDDEVVDVEFVRLVVIEELVVEVLDELDDVGVLVSVQRQLLPTTYGAVLVGGVGTMTFFMKS